MEVPHIQKLHVVLQLMLSLSLYFTVSYKKQLDLYQNIYLNIFAFIPAGDSLSQYHSAVVPF